LISDGLLSSKIQTSILIDSRRLKWLLINELQLIFVVAYQETFSVPYVEVLLDLMKDKFVKAILPLTAKQNGIYRYFLTLSLVPSRRSKRDSLR
jgi:hypothetical protein